MEPQRDPDLEIAHQPRTPGQQGASGGGWLPRQTGKTLLGWVIPAVVLRKGEATSRSGRNGGLGARIRDKSRGGGRCQGSGRRRDSAVRGGRRPEMPGDTWSTLNGSSLWTELCLVPTAARWTAQPIHLRNCLRPAQDWGTKSPQPQIHKPMPPPPGCRSGWMPAGRGRCSPTPILPA